MKATFISKENNIAKFSVEFTAEELTQAQNEVYKKNKHRFTVDGFRKGKAPRSIIEKFYGAGVFLDDAINELVTDGYTKGIAELELMVINQPVPEFVDEIEIGKGFTVNFDVEVYPEFKVEGYKGVEIERVSDEVTDEMLNMEMENLRKRNG